MNRACSTSSVKHGCCMRDMPGLGYFLYDEYLQMAGNHFLIFMMMMIVCGIIGGLIGYKIHCRNQNNYQEIIDQIEDVTKE